MTYRPNDNPEWDAVRGLVGAQVGRIGGAAVLLDTDRNDLWAELGTYPWPTLGSTLEIVSDDPLDAYGAQGAMVLHLLGIDSSWNRVEEVVVMTGDVPVVTVNEFIRLNVMTVVAVGDDGLNLGKITASHGGVTIGVVKPGDGRDYDCKFSCPVGWSGYLTNVVMNVGDGDVVKVELVRRRNPMLLGKSGHPFIAEWRGFVRGFAHRKFDLPFAVYPGEDSMVRVTSMTGNAEIECFADGMLLPGA